MCHGLCQVCSGVFVLSVPGPMVRLQSSKGLGEANKGSLADVFLGRTLVESLRRKVGLDYKPSLLGIQFKKIKLGTNE